MTDGSITEAAHRVRRSAEAGPIGKRKSSFELYTLLADCMALVERCEATKSDLVEMRNLVTQRPADGRRHYVEAQSDAFIVVCRFVFHDLKSDGASRSNASRYAMCLREARSAGIHSTTLAAHLRDRGGINALFLFRPLAARSVTTRCLNLASPITVSKGVRFRLVLRRMPDNRYEVFECEDEGPALQPAATDQPPLLTPKPVSRAM